jgi:hypothetical protein
MLRAFGLAWSYDHVVLVLPAKKLLADYTPWISHYRESVIQHKLSNSKPTKVEPQIVGTRHPRAHAISVNVPRIDAKDEAAIEALSTEN